MRKLKEISVDTEMTAKHAGPIIENHLDSLGDTELHALETIRQMNILLAAGVVYWLANLLNHFAHAVCYHI